MRFREDYIDVEVLADSDEVVYKIKTEDDCSLTLNIYELRSLTKILNTIKELDK